jgi:hypothetical protein
VAEFAPAEFGGLLRISDTAAHGLIGDALDLRHRFPRLWAQVHAGGVDVWIARKTVQQTRTLSKEAAARVDEKIAGLAGTLGWPRLRRIVAAAVLAADPPKALSEAERAASEAGARVEDHVDHGYATIIIKATAGDIAELNHALGLIADALATLGDTSTLDRRRATAAGIIAHPTTAMDLLTQADTIRHAQAQAQADAAAADDEAAAARCDEDGEPAGQTETTTTGSDGSAARKRSVWKKAVLYYHISKETLDAILAGKQFAGAGVVRVEDIGPVIADQVCQWLGHTQVVVKPVIDLAAIPPSTTTTSHHPCPKPSGSSGPPTTDHRQATALEDQRHRQPP